MVHVVNGLSIHACFPFTLCTYMSSAFYRGGFFHLGIVATLVRCSIPTDSILFSLDHLFLKCLCVFPVISRVKSGRFLLLGSSLLMSARGFIFEIYICGLATWAFLARLTHVYVVFSFSVAYVRRAYIFS